MPEDLILDQETRSEIPVQMNEPPPSNWKEFFKDKKIIFGTIGALLAIALIFWFFFSQSNTGAGPDSSNVLLLIKGPETLASDNETEYTVVYRNGENADMVNVSLEMFYPNGFKFKSSEPKSVASNGQIFNLPLVKEGKDGQVVIRGKLSGGTGEDKEIKARLRYTLSNFNSQFAVEQSFHTSILPPNLTVEITGPVDVVNGQDSTFIVNYTNVSDQDYSDLAIQLAYPAGFSYVSASAQPAQANNYWKLPVLPSGHSSSITVTGSFTGDNFEEKLVRANLGKVINNNFAPQVVSTASFRVIPSSLTVKVEASPSTYVKLGDTINYKLSYANQGTIGLSNLVITLNLDGPALDLTRISASNGIITGKTITWKAATLSNLSVLSPNERGEITFSVPVKNTLTTNLKNQTITAQAAIQSDEITQPTKSAASQLKLISNLGLTVSGGYVSGAAPMKAGETTVFEINFLLTNLSNDAASTQVVASMPLPSSAWKNVVIPEAEKTRLTYDPNSGKITWKIGDLAAFTGKFTPALQATFQLAVTPTEADRGKTMTLLTNIQATGVDSFVNENLQTQNIATYTVSDLQDDVLNLKGVTVQ